MVNTIPESTDVLIVGAGPAGATTSLFLEQLGVDHLVVDQAEFPRDKICGDALSGKVIDVLARLDLQWIQEMESLSDGFLPCYGITFVAPNGTELSIPFRTRVADRLTAAGFISARMDFDAFLVSKIRPDRLRTSCTLKQIHSGPAAGASSPKGTHSSSSGLFNPLGRFNPFHPFQPLQPSRHNPNGNGAATPHEVTLLHQGQEHRVRSKYLVGCEGERSLVAKQLAGYTKQKEHYCAALRAYYTGVTGCHPDHYIELHFLQDILPGYLWIFPMSQGRYNVGIGMASHQISRKKVRLKEAFERAIREIPALKDRFRNAQALTPLQGWGLPLGSKQFPLSGEGFLLVGDSGSLIDPFTGEGIGNAMKAGYHAAHFLKDSLQQGRRDASWMKGYDHKVYRDLGGELRLGKTMQQLTNYPRLFNLVVGKAARNKELQQLISTMFDDISLRNQLSNPLFYLKLLFRSSGK